MSTINSALPGRVVHSVSSTKRTKSHFHKWYVSHKSHLRNLYQIYCYESDDTIMCDFNNFVDYVYHKSSGQIGQI